MATWVPHLRLTFGGTIGTTTTETWSNTIRFHMMNTVPSADNLQAAAVALEAPIKTWFTSVGASINGTAKLSWIKLNWVTANGSQRDQQTIIHEFTAVPGGGSVGTQAVPWFQTVALTFRTRLKRGRGHSGRIFPPLVAVSVASDQPYIGAAQANGLASAGRTLLTSVRSTLGTSFAGIGGEIPVPSVFSPGDGASKPPLFVPIIGVVCDRVPDVQHRRTKQVPRAESTTALLDP